jgi:hypothetical protein
MAPTLVFGSLENKSALYAASLKYFTALSMVIVQIYDMLFI